MAREKKKKSRAGKELAPEDVLEGRVKVDAMELFRLIHRVNPTNRRLSRKEAERRYEQKNKLQSFLVLNYGDDHVVVSPTEQEGVVSLDHPSGIFDACHAPLAALDPEARAWVQQRLDTAGDGDDEALRLPDYRGAQREAPEDPLTKARHALAEFDYAKAERLLTAAFDAGPVDVPVVVELLALKVETLGLDDEALALYPRLGATALDDVDVRALLALAAARQGQHELAEKLLSGLGHAGAATFQKRLAAAYAARAAAAVAAGDEAAARRWLDELVDCDPFHEGVATVRAGLERLAEAAMRKAETELDARYHERGCLEAAAAARALADRWPGSEVARRILREAGELRRQTAVAEHLEVADRALAEEDFDTAVRHYEAVLAEDPDVPDVPRRLEQARRGARERAEASAVAAVERRFAEDGRRRALLAYLELPPALRARLRSRLEDADDGAAVDDLDAVDAAHPRLRAVAKVDAVLALREAEKLLAEERGGKSWATLEPHKEVLAVLPRTAALQDEIFDYVVKEGAQRNVDLIRQVDAAMKDETAAREPEKTLELLEEIDPSFLTPQYRQWLETARSMLLQAAELSSLADAYQRELKAGQLFAARQRARRYKEITEKVLPAGLRTFQLPGKFLDDEIKRVWQVQHESWRLGRRLGPYPGVLQPRPGLHWRSESRGIDDEGRRLVVAQAFVDWLFLSIVDVRSGKLLERLSMNTPKPLGVPLAVCWDGDRIRIGGGDGGVLVLEPEGWKIAEWEWLPRHLGKGEVSRTVVLPRSPYVWVLSRNRGTTFSKVRVLERDAWRTMRQRPRVLTASVLYGLREEGSEEPSPEPRLLVSDGHGSILCTARGHRDADEPVAARHTLAAAADGTGIVALLLSPPGDLETVGPPVAGESAGRGLGLARFERAADGRAADGRAADGRAACGWRLAREVRVASASAGEWPVMTSADGVVWTLFDAADGEAWLLAVDGETLEPLYSLRVPHTSALAGDRHGRHAALLLDGESGPEVVRLGREQPRLEWRWRPLAERALPVLDLHLCCMTEFPQGREALKKFDAVPRPRRREHVLKMARESTAANLEEVILLAYVLHKRDSGLAREYLAELGRRHSENLDVVFVLGDWECRLASATWALEDWKRALEMVLGFAPEYVTMFRRHFHHVQGMGNLLAGRFDEAVKSFEAGLEHDDGGCDLAPLLELAKPMKSEPKPSQWNVKKPLTRQVRGALYTAAAAFTRNDDKAVIAALERPSVWLAGEIETLTRLALAYTALIRDPADAGFETRLALSYLLEVIRVNGPRRMPPVKLANAADAVKQVEETMREWLAIPARAEANLRKEKAES